MLHLCGRKTADDHDKEERRRHLIRACFSPKVRLHRLVLLTTDGDYHERKSSLEHLNIKEEVWECPETEAACPIQDEKQKPQINWRQTEENVKEEPSNCSLADLIKKESHGDTQETNVSVDWQEPQFESSSSRNHKKKMCTSRKNINTGKKSISDKFYAEKNQKEKHSRKSCDVCGKHFSDITHQRRHMRFHTGEKPFSCDLCGQTFTQKSTLTGHMRVHAGEKPFSWGVCGKRFSSNKLLTSHMSSHTGQKPFSCDVCAHAFSQKAHLTSHMSIHTGVKPFICSVCRRSFRRNTHLRSHMRVHLKKKNPL